MRCASAGAERPKCGLRAGPAYVVIPQLRRSIIDGSEIRFYPWERRAVRYAISGLVIVTLVLFGLFVIAGIYGLKIHGQRQVGFCLSPILSKIQMFNCYELVTHMMIKGFEQCIVWGWTWAKGPT